MEQPNTNLLEAKGITKYFPGVRALDNVDLAVTEGSIHCVIGENGAGKSTLVRILTGVYHADSGEVLIAGEDAKRNNTLFERVAYVPQELDLFNEMTVAENLFMPFGRAGFRGGLVHKRKLFEASKEYIERFDIRAKPTDLVKQLSVSSKQLLQIARAYTSKAFSTLILDEPTTSLTTHEIDILFEILRRVRAEGKSVVFISHKLQEVFEIGDEVTVLRNGKIVGREHVNDVAQPWIIQKMSGEEVDVDRTFIPSSPDEKTLLRVEHLSGPGFHDVSFELHEGEILGFAGLVGSGRTEIMQTVYGFYAKSAGRVDLLDRELSGQTYHAMERGLVYLPEERKQQGILPELSVRHNIGVGFLNHTSTAGVVNATKEKRIVREILDRYDVRTPSMERLIKYLSGGNQQKALIGRALFGKPKVLIFDEPTKGIDVKTKYDIYAFMRKLAEEQRVGLLLVSSEMEELLRCANRVVTIYQGRKTGEFDVRETDRSTIMGAMINANEGENRDE